MNILGLDYGRNKIGVAWSNGVLSSPLEVIRFKQLNFAVTKIQEIVTEFEIEKIVVGISEGLMAQECLDFAANLAQKLGLPVETSDETLSTHDAIAASIESGMGREKRKEMEDAFAAAIMLQNYLDEIN